MPSRVLLVLLLLGCEGTISYVTPGADAGSMPPVPQLDAGPPLPPGSDAGPVVDAGPTPGPIPTPDAGAPEATGINWKAVLITGDDSINAFDNARERIGQLLLDDGVLPENIIHLSRDASEQTGGVRDSSVATIEQAMLDLNVGEGDGCFVHMTSHGNRTGFYIAGRDYLTPDRLDQILDRACGDRPTVALISACYSGVFVPALQAPNRVVLTAAHADRTSFGCSAEATYTYWDGCLIDELPMSADWSTLYAQVTKCIERKEARGFTPSLPQASFGDAVSDLRILNR